MSHWQVIRLGRGLEENAASWDRVNAVVASTHPMLTSVFVDQMLFHFGDGRQYLCTQIGPDGPQAMCIVQRREAGLWTTFLPAQAQVGLWLLPGPDCLRSLVSHLPGFAIGIDLLCVDPELVDLSVLGEDADASHHALTMSVNLTGGYDAYWNARPSGLRQNLRRYERRALTDGLEPRFVEICASAEMVGAVHRYAQLESQGWKEARGTALKPDNGQGRFYAHVMKSYAESGRATVYELWLGDQLAASRLVVLSGDMLVMLKTTYAESLDKYAPGRLLLRQVLQQMFEQHPGKVVEFYTDATQDQQAWATGLRPIKHWTIYRSKRAAKAIAALRALRLLWRHVPFSVDHMGLSVELVPSVDGLPTDALKLLDAGEALSIQFGSDWYRALCAAVFKDQSLMFAVVRSGDACVAVLPTRLNRTRFTGEVQSLSNYYTALYAPALRPGVKPAALVPAILALAKACGGSTRFSFAPMDPRSVSFQNLSTAFELAGWVPFKFFCFGNWVLQTHETWLSYEAGLDSRLRNTVARMQRRFQREGGTLEIVQEPGALETALDSYLAVYAKSWKVAEPYPAFLPEIVRRFGPRKCLRLGLAWFQGKPIAAQLWFVADGRADIYKLAHDEQFKRFSPGTLLTARMLQQAMEVDLVREVDYLIGDDPYKKDWMRGRRERWGLVAYNPRSVWGFIGLLREISGRFVKAVWGRTPG